MASSDSIIRNVYRSVFGKEADGDAIEAARTIPDNQLAQFFNSGGVQSYLSSPERMAQKAIDDAKKATEEFFKPYEEAAARSKEYDEKNPFTFDEALARASAKERFDPYYDSELNDFVTGISRQRERGTQDEEKLRQEISTDTEKYVGRAARDLNDAIQASNEGYAGAGLFFSGQRTRREGQIGIKGNEAISDIQTEGQRKIDESQTRQGRLLEDLASSEATGRRKLAADKETAILGDIEGQRKEQLQQRELGRQQYVGYPLSTGTSSLRSILGI